MYICICNGITDRQIRKAAADGVRDLRQLQHELGVATGCGSCEESASEILRESRKRQAFPEPRIYQPALA